VTLPRVTVAVATYNRAHLVGRAIASVQAQTVPSIEIIVVDDGSTDDTPIVLASVDDARMRVIRHPHNRGISRARNTAIAAARADWLTFLDDDNEWATDYLERQLALAAAHPDAGVVYCRARRLDSRTGREMIVPYRIARGRVFRDLVSGWIPLMSCTLFGRAMLAEIGGLDERLEASEDRDVFLRLAQRTEFAASPDILVTRHEHFNAQLSRDYAKLRRDADRLSDKWSEAIATACGRMALRRWRAMLVALAEMAETTRSVEERRRPDGVRSVARMARHLPWSLPAVTRGALMLILGLERFGRAGLMWSGLRANVVGTARAKPYHRP
jgi:glycosyltransferase involved in cell wall biosynthesis